MYQPDLVPARLRVPCASSSILCTPVARSSSYCPWPHCPVSMTLVLYFYTFPHILPLILFLLLFLFPACTFPVPSNSIPVHFLSFPVHLPHLSCTFPATLVYILFLCFLYLSCTPLLFLFVTFSVSFLQLPENPLYLSYAFSVSFPRLSCTFPVTYFVYLPCLFQLPFLYLSCFFPVPLSLAALRSFRPVCLFKGTQA
jgi:hypothetical protein